ncbi:MAG: bifunctional riboflavin kinase/FAD synthetase [Burkholderiaceae bacterium]|jgi:riboflavin kinase/FMN adenylyltransferase|nr:bifunctional riboflavin kinase/FAD synthetase [Burkholderiaceae bacterium]
MEIFRRQPPPDRRRPCALTIGNFDGMHVGHRAVIATLREKARERGLPICVLTFEPHPREYFASLAIAAGHPDATAPTRISTLRDKVAALADCGVDRVCIARFDASLASLSPQQFVEKILVGSLQTRYLLIGDDFRFGARRAGDYALLQRLAQPSGFELERLTTIEREGERVSSSSVRAALAAGDFPLAAALLGRPYSICGRVLHGKKLGRTLGFPTMNVRIPFARPAVHGVFVVRAHGLREAPVQGVASLGTRPAVESNGQLLLETHLFDFDEPTYGRLVRVEFVAKLRDERSFDSLDALREQIALDAHDAREKFAREAQDARAHFARTDEARAASPQAPLSPPDSAD